MANITRIKNNQITDSTIEYTKIKPGTLVGSVFNANITLNSNVTIVGNLSVSGSTATVQSTNTYINDPLVIFNNGYTSSPAYDIGILVNRNLTATAPYGSVNAALVWQEAAKGFAAVMTTETGTTQGAINNSGYANIFVGNTYANTVTVRDNTVSSSNSTGALVVTGGTGIGGNLNVGGSLNVEGAFGVTGNLTTTAGGLISGATTSYLFNETATTINLGAAATTINVGNSSGTTNLSGILKTSGNIVAQSTTDSTDLTTGSIVTLGGLAVAKNITASSAVITTTLATNFSSGNARITGGYIDNSPIGATTANTGAFTTLTTTGTIISGGNIVANSGTNTTGATNGALVVNGGVGVNGNLFVGTGGGNYSIFRGNVGIGPNIATADLDGLLTVSLNTIHSSDIGALGHFIGKDTFPARISVDTYSSTNLTDGPNYVGRRARGTGASPSAVQTGDRLLIVGARGYGATGFSANSRAYIDVRASENWTDTAQGAHVDIGVTETGTTNTRDVVSFFSDGNVVMFGNLESTSTTSGALTVHGGVGIARNINVGGDAYVAGNLTVQGDLTYINTTTLTVEDKILELGTGANGAPLVSATINDVGVRARYYDTSEKSAFFGRTRDTGFFEYYSAATETSGNISGTYGTIKSGEMIIANSTAASSTTSGALVVTGGAGVGGALYVGGLIQAGSAQFASINNTPIGNATPSTGAFTTLTTTGTIISGGNVVANSGTASTNTTTGALVVVGGTGISGALNVGSTVVADGNVVANSGTASTSTTTGALVVAGGTGISGALNVGSTVIAGGNVVANSGTASTNTTTGALVVAGGVGISGQASIGGNAVISSDAVITGDAYINGGDVITSATTFNLLNATATTVNFAGAATTLNTGNASGTTNMSGVVKVGGNIVAQSNTDSTSTTTGSIVSLGGIGVAANVVVGQAATFNSSKTAGMNFIVKGDNDDTLIWAIPNATYDQVLIGNSAVTANVVQGAKLQVNSTDSMLLPTGTTAQRPSSVGFTDVTGMLRYNTTLGYIEFYTGTQWNGVSTQFTVITDEQFNGDGVETEFTLGGTVTTNATIVSINGVIQIPTLAYSVSGTTLTFTEAPASGDVIDVRRLTTTQTVQAISSQNGYNQFLVDNDGAYVTAGDSSATPITHWDTSGAQVHNRANTAVSSANTATTIDSFSNSTYRSAKYIIQVTNGANYQVMEALVIQDGTTATIMPYGILDTNGNLGVLDATVSSGDTLVQFIAANANTNVRVAKDYFVI